MIITPDITLQLLHTAKQAGELIMTYYKMGNEVFHKEDLSPVTEADRAADRLIVAHIKSIFPAIPIVSEEGDKPNVSDAEYFWLIDPLDGTKSFIRGHGYFTVNIALVDKDNIPVFGVIYDPVNKIIYWGSKEEAFREFNTIIERIRVRKKQDKLSAFVSHNTINKATEDYLAAHNIDERIACASSIKFCFVAEGRADLYPRFGPTMEWDTAAGHAILLAAGGKVITPEGTPLQYRKSGFLNGNFIAVG